MTAALSGASSADPAANWIELRANDRRRRLHAGRVRRRRVALRGRPLLHGERREGDAPVLRPPLGGGVVGDRLRLAVALRHRPRQRQPLRAQRRQHRLGALLAQPQVPALRALGVGVAADLEGGVRAAAQRRADLLEHRAALLGQRRGAGGELDRPLGQDRVDLGRAGLAREAVRFGGVRRLDGRRLGRSRLHRLRRIRRHQGELDPPVRGPPGLAGVVGHRRAGAEAAGGQPHHRQVLGPERRQHRLRPRVAQPLVRLGASPANRCARRSRSPPPGSRAARRRWRRSPPCSPARCRPSRRRTGSTRRRGWRRSGRRRARAAAAPRPRRRPPPPHRRRR